MYTLAGPFNGERGVMKATERNRRYRKILLLRAKDKTFAEIGETLGITRQRAHQIYKEALNDGTPTKRNRSRKSTRRKVRPLRRVLRGA